MSLSPYTTPALVRNALGVAAKERKDLDLDNRPNESWMKEQLYEISDTLPADLLALFGLSSPSAEQARLRDLGELYCTTAVALREVTSVPLFAPKIIKDDRTLLERIDDPFKNLRGELTSTLAYLNGRMRKLYALQYPGAVLNEPQDLVLSTVVGIVSSPSTDPVTGS